MAILRQHETGVSIVDLARDHGCSTARIYQLRSKCGRMDAPLLKGMKKREADNVPA